MINKAKDFPFTQSQSKIELNDSTIEKFQATEPTKPNAYVEVKAVGKGLTYQWYIKFKDSEDWKELADSNVSRYYIGGLKGVSREFDGAKFKCKVSNSKGSVISDEVTLTVAEEEIPAITTQPSNQSIDPGEYDALTKRRFAKYVIAVNGSGSGGGTTTDEHNKGWFTEPSALPATGENGDYAIVGTTDTVWVWDSDSNSWVDTGATNTVKTVNGIGPDDHGEITLSAKDVNTYTTTELDTRITSLNSKILTKEDKLNYYEEQDGASYIITNASETTKNGGHIKFEAKGGATDAGFIDIDAKRQTTGEGGEISIIAESKSIDATQDSAINIQADKISLTGLVKINQQEIQSIGTVKSVNSQGPDENGNVKITAANIEDISLTKGGNDLAVIKIGELELSALTPDSNVASNKISGRIEGSKILGSVSSATTADKATGDKDGNDITTTYAKAADVNTLTTTVSGKQDISNLVTDINSASTDTTYPSAKIVYNSINAVDSKVKAIISTVGDENSGLVKDVTQNGSDIATLKSGKQDKANLVSELSSTSTDTTYPSAKAVYDYVQTVKPLAITSTVEITITPTDAKTATTIPDALNKAAKVIVVPNYGNVGAIYIKESDTYSSINPIYPDPTNNTYEFTNMQNVKVFADSVGDNVDLVIEYRG